MRGLFPCIPILRVFIFDEKVLWEWRFKFLCETNPLSSFKMHYSEIYEQSVNHLFSALLFLKNHEK